MLIGGWDDPNGASVLVSTECDEAQHRACQRAGRHPEGGRRCQES